MSGSWHVAVGAFAVAALGCRDPKESPKPGPSGDEPSESAQKPAHSAPAAPALPVEPADAAAPVPIDAAEALAGSGEGSQTASPIMSFEAQTRDPAWAPKVEREIKQRFEKIRGAKLEATECRHSSCSITVAGSEGDIGQTIADLESSRGMHGYAKNVVLSAPVQKADGTWSLRATVVFERKP